MYAHKTASKGDKGTDLTEGIHSKINSLGQETVYTNILINKHLFYLNVCCDEMVGGKALLLQIRQTKTKLIPSAH